MAGRKTKLTPERQEKILDCVRIGMSNKAAAQMAGISEKTLYNWIECGEKDASGPFFEFLKSLQAATVQFELSNCRIIHRSATEETRIVRQTIRYKSGEVVNGKLVDGKFTSATVVIETRPPSVKSAMWLLERQFPKKWGRQAGGDARRGRQARGEAPEKPHATIIFTRPDNGSMDQTEKGTTAQTARGKRSSQNTVREGE